LGPPLTFLSADRLVNAPGRVNLPGFWSPMVRYESNLKSDATQGGESYVLTQALKPCVTFGRLGRGDFGAWDRLSGSGHALHYWPNENTPPQPCRFDLKTTGTPSIFPYPKL